MTCMQHALACAGIGLVLALQAAPARAEPRLVFEGAPTQLARGDRFELLLQGAGFDFSADGRRIDRISGGQQLGLFFTPEVLELVSVTIAPRWSYAPARHGGQIDNAAGTLSGLSFGSFPATTDDSFAIVSLGFRALAAGPASVGLSGVDLIGQLDGQAGVRFGVEAVATTLSVSAVPEPQAALLLALGGCGLWLQRRRARAGLRHG